MMNRTQRIMKMVLRNNENQESESENQETGKPEVHEEIDWFSSRPLIPSHSDHMGPSKVSEMRLRRNWSCNRPLSPVQINQSQEVSSSLPNRDSVADISKADIYDWNADTDYLDGDIDNLNVDIDDFNSDINDLYADSDDSIADPDFLPSEDEEPTYCGRSDSLCRDDLPDSVTSSDTSREENTSSILQENIPESATAVDSFEAGDYSSYGSPITELQEDIPSMKIHKSNKTSNGNSVKIISNVLIRPHLSLGPKKVLMKDFCYFCESLVSNFARHLKRSHSSEIEVQRIFSLPSRNQQRKNLISDIRKKGNYLKNSSECFKPMKKPQLAEDISKYKACEYCLGYYAPKQLWRHKKKCMEKLNGEPKNLLNSMKFPKVDPRLRETVFPTMRHDKISLTAQKDVLICAFVSRYLKTHREIHQISVASRKMRELGRLLIELIKIDPTIHNLFNALQPKHYDKLVDATKISAGYNSEKESYSSPTFAINMGTTLKQCCDVALVYVLKKKEIYSTIPSAEAEASLNTLMNLLTSNWKYDISSQAATNLNVKKWNKITIVPLATDLKLLKEHLLSTASNVKSQLIKNSNDEKAFRILLETIFCRVILLNRKRPGELQRLQLEAYISSEKSNQNQNYEEFSDAITPTEKVLMQTFRRLVIRGKRGRGVPVLFSTDVQKDIQTMLTYRSTFIPEENKYFFGVPHTKSHIYGYKVLAKYAASCGARNHHAITCTRLRKHLATLTQVFNMSESDLEQLATFMGHTAGIHRQSYRLPDDVYQTAKIAKILLLMEKGTCAQFKGKTIDEININLEEDLIENCDNQDQEVFSNSDTEYDHMQCDSEINNMEVEFEGKLTKMMETAEDHVKQKTCLSITKNIHEMSKNEEKEDIIEKKRIERFPWTMEQKEVVTTFFNSHIKSKKPPKKKECEELKDKFPELLQNKDWLKIKVMVQNIYTQKLKS